MQTSKRAVVIHSLASGRAMQLSQALSSLDRAGIEVIRLIEVTDLAQQPVQGKDWAEQGVQIAIAAGGDGVIGSVINQIARSVLPLGIMPLGTSNDIARSLDIPLDMDDAARTIATGHVRRIDLGAARSPGVTGTTAEAPSQDDSLLYGYFAHVLTIGLNVQFAQIATNVATRKRYGRLTYPVAALEVLRKPEVLSVRLQFEGLRLPPYVAGQDGDSQTTNKDHVALNCRALQVTVINAPVFGGAWHITLPGSTLDDNLLDVVVFEEGGLARLNARLALFFNSPPLGNEKPEDEEEVGEFIHHPAELTGLLGVHHLQARGITIATEQDPQPVTLDGEIRGHTPLYVELVENFLPVLVPEEKKSTATQK